MKMILILDRMQRLRPLFWQSVHFARVLYKPPIQATPHTHEPTAHVHALHDPDEDQND